MPRRGTDRAEVILATDQKQLTPELRRATKKFERFGARVRGRLTNTFKGIGRSLATLGGFAGAAGLAAVGKEVIALDKRMVRFGLNTRKAGEPVTKIVAGLRGELKKLSNQTGLDQGDLMGGVESFLSKTGDAKGAVKNAELFAKVVQVTGASMEDTAGAAAALAKTMGFDETNFEKAFDIMIVGGRAGAIEIRELAAEVGKVAPQFEQFGVRGAKGLAIMNGALQTLAPSFGFSASETATGFRSLMTALAKNAKKIQKASGVKIFTVNDKGEKQFRAIRDIVAELGESKLAKDPTALTKALGRAEAVRAFQVLNKNLEGWTGLADTMLENTTLAKDWGEVQKSAGVKGAKAMQRLKNKMMDVFTPERIDKLVAAFEKFVDLMTWVIDNIGLVAGGFVAIKAAISAISLVGLAKDAGAFAGAIGRAAKGFGALSALAAGFTIGTMLDEALGLSDKISEKLAEKSHETTDFQFLRDVAARQAAGKKVNRAGQVGIIEQATRGGVLKGGEIDLVRAFQIANPEAAERQRMMRGMGGGGFENNLFEALADPKTMQLAMGVRGAAAAQPEQLKISIEVQRDGMLKTQAALSKMARRFGITVSD